MRKCIELVTSRFSPGRREAAFLLPRMMSLDRIMADTDEQTEERESTVELADATKRIFRALDTMADAVYVAMDRVRLSESKEIIGQPDKIGTLLDKAAGSLASVLDMRARLAGIDAVPTPEQAKDCAPGGAVRENDPLAAAIEEWRRIGGGYA